MELSKMLDATSFHSSNSGWLLFSMALTLGIRHGFDLDHLATIDSVTRTVSNHRYLSKIVGFLFSLGHGMVVIVISLIIGSGIMQSHIPGWLDRVGNWISILFLFIFGLLNIWNVVQHPSKQVVPTSIKNYLSKKIIQQKFNAIYIVLIGALFALSFDTFSQIALFSLSASALAGCLFSLLLGVIFMFGMMTSDGLNGLFVSTLIQRADRMSIIISRLTGLLIALFSLIIGIMNLAKCLTR